MLNQDQLGESQEADARTRRSGDGGVKCEVRLWWTTVRSGQVRNDGGIKMQG